MDRANIKAPQKLLSIALLGISLATCTPQSAEASISQYSIYDTTLDMYDSIETKNPQPTRETNTVLGVIGGLTVLSYAVCGYINKKRAINIVNKELRGN